MVFIKEELHRAELAVTKKPQIVGNSKLAKIREISAITPTSEKIHYRLKVKSQIRKDWVVVIMRRCRILEAQISNWSLKPAWLAQQKLQKSYKGGKFIFKKCLSCLKGLIYSCFFQRE